MSARLTFTCFYQTTETRENMFKVKTWSRENMFKRWNMFKVNNKNTKTTRHWRHSGVFIVNFEHISHLFLVLLLLTLDKVNFS